MSNIDTAIRPLAANHVLIDTDLTPDETRQVLELGLAVKRSPKDFGAVLRGRYAAMLFEKPSLRTRVTFELGMKQLGGGTLIAGSM